MLKFASFFMTNFTFLQVISAKCIYLHLIFNYATIYTFSNKDAER